jgi:hypothetical protein
MKGERVARKPDYYFTDPSGQVRPGFKPRRRGPVVVVIALALALAAGGAGAVGTGVGVGGNASASGSRVSGSKSSARARDRDPLRTVRRLEQRGLRVEQRGTSFDQNCAAHAYGHVQQFFQEHPCSALYRALLEVRDRHQNRVLVAVAWVDMPDEAQAAAFQRLVDRHGTGNITELSQEQRRYRPVRFTGEHYASARNGVTVVNVQAEPLGRTAAAAALAEAVVAEAG